MGAVKHLDFLAIDDYLRGEIKATVRHEYVAGQAFAMAGGTVRHNRICTRAFMALEPMVTKQHCESYLAEVKLRTKDAVYYPDVMVVCDKSDDDPLIKSAPCLLIEVLSESTARTDRTEKLIAYQSILTLRNYLLIEQNARRIALYRRHGLIWQREIYTGDDEIQLDCPSGTIGLAQIYDGLEFTPQSDDEALSF